MHPDDLAAVLRGKILLGGETGVGPRRKAGAAWLRGGVAQNRSSDLCVTS